MKLDIKSKVTAVCIICNEFVLLGEVDGIARPNDLERYKATLHRSDWVMLRGKNICNNCRQAIKEM